MAVDDWQAVAGAPVLAQGELHVWLARLDLERDGDAGPLGAEERARAERFRFDRDRRRFARSHAMVRRVLGAYLGRRAASLEFVAGPRGKPGLLGGGPLHFNLAHSGELALLGVAERELGVDVEAHDPRPLEGGVAERFFAPEEVADLQALPEPDRVAAFFRCWTRKEAYLKALGGGLTLTLRGFRVSLLPAPGNALLRPLPEGLTWWLESLQVDLGYSAAVALQPPLRARRFLYREDAGWG